MTLFISGGTLFHVALTSAFIFVALVAFSAAYKPKPPKPPFDYPDHDDY